jgi:hypothetical protein
MYLLATAWGLVAAAAFCGYFWARSDPRAPIGDQVLLIVAGGVAVVEVVCYVTVVLTAVNYGSIAVYDAAHVMFTVADISLGIAILVAAARYRKHRVAPGGHGPLAPLLIAGISYLGVVYGDVFSTSWFGYSTFNSDVSAILFGLSYAGVGIAVLLAAIMRLGPVYRLLVAGAALVVVGVAAGIVQGVYLKSGVAAVLIDAQAAAYFVLAAVLLGTALLTPASRQSPLGAPRLPPWALPGGLGGPGGSSGAVPSGAPSTRYPQPQTPPTWPGPDGIPSVPPPRPPVS